MTTRTEQLPGPHDALVLIDVQRCFMPGGTLPVPYGDEIVPVLNHYIDRFHDAGRPIVATRDWHPPNHCSFHHQGGHLPPHCIADTEDADFTPDLHLPRGSMLIAKGTRADRDAYSGFDGTDLADILHRLDVMRLFVGGLATDHCVLNTVRAARRNGFGTFLLLDAIRAFDLRPGDGQRAIGQMMELGAEPLTLEGLDA